MEALHSKFRTRITLVAFLLLAPVSVLTAANIATDGRAQATIVHHGQVKPARVLAEYIKKISGGVPALAETNDKNAETVIELRLLEKVPGTSDRLTAEHAYRLTTNGDRLLITAQSELGLEYAVYGLLQDHLGVGFYSETYEYVPGDPDLALPKLDELQEPAFYHRNPMHFQWSPATGNATKVYARKNREFPPSGSPHNASHTFRKYGTHKNCPLW